MRFTVESGRRAGRRSQLVQRERRLSGAPPDRCDVPVGRLLHTIRVESHVNGLGFEIKIYQAQRRNQIVAETFGRRARPKGVDWLTRHLRQRLVTRWLTP